MSQIDNHIDNLCCDSHCSIVLHTFQKFITVLLVIRFWLNFFSIGLSDSLLLLKVSNFSSGFVL